MGEKQEREALALTNKINLMKLFPKILNVEKENFKITPSQYIKEMSLTMEERHTKLVHLNTISKPANTADPHPFKMIPNILTFQRFEARSTNRLVLEIKNIGKNLVPIKMHCPSSVYFSATFKGVPVNKLAPGLSLEFEITFTPKEARDYSHHLVIISKDITFQVPIIAIGPRPLLDIPDQILLKPSPVKIPTTKFIVVRNIGDAPAVFNFIIQSIHFQISPSKGILGVHESVVLNVTFESSKAEEVTEPIILALETGEKLFITLHGSAENVCVRLDKTTVVHEDTFVGLKRCKTIRLLNNSSNVIKFSWKQNETIEEEVAFIERLKPKFQELSELEILKDMKVLYSGLSNAERHKLSCERILQDELRMVEKEDLNFHDESFSIIPQSGEVWPKGSVEIITAFEPKTYGLISAEAYLEVSGKDTRLPLRMKGVGLGPLITMNTKTLDIDYIYLCSMHRYEVIAQNKGDIPGSIEYLQEPLIFGGKVEVIPEMRQLKPGEIGGFVISFTSNRQGDFTEKLNFVVKESQEKVAVILKGKIVNPTLHFDIKQIDFGVVPIGFSQTQVVTLNNLSVVPVTFSLRILSDGDVPSISYEQFASFTVKPTLPQYPKEFLVEPEESAVEPFSSKKVTVTLTANKPGHFQAHLVVDMWDSENGAITCPISYQAHIATLMAEPEIINIPFCFINFPYTRSITLKNLSKVAGFFYIIPTDPNAESPITCSASIPQGIVQPRDSIKIDVTIITSILGRQSYTINFLTLGNESPKELCKVYCAGQGPVVTVNPVSLNWGDVVLLERVDKTLEISNESPIPASVTISLSKQNSQWSVDPSSVTIESEKSVTVTVSLSLNDRGKFKEALKVNVYNGKLSMVPLLATGIGSSLTISPKISPTFNLGTLFCHKKYDFEIMIENKGSKNYGLVWSPTSDYKTFANAKFTIPPENNFRILPVKMEIQPGETRSAILEARGAKVGFFSNTFFCFASIGGPAKEVHLTSEICAEFVNPVVSFDKTDIHFYYNLGYEHSEENLCDTVNIINLSVLPISVRVVTGHPFYLENEAEDLVSQVAVSLEGYGGKELTVKFVAEENQNRESKSYKGNLVATLTDEAKMCSVKLKGDVNYPNIVVLPKIVNFGHVPVGTSASMEIYLVNVSPMTVYYDVKWDLSKSEVVYYDKPMLSSKSVVLDVAESREHYGELEIGDNSTEEEEEPLTDKNSLDACQTVAPPVKPFPRMPHIEITKSDIRTALFPITRNYHETPDELTEAYKISRITDAKANPFNVLFDVTPFYGKLEAYGSQILFVNFCSAIPVEARMDAIITVKSGPPEVITISAISAEIDFQLSTVELDFGKQLFCETKTKTLWIQNTAVMPFTYETDAENNQMCEFNDHSPPRRGVLTVTPKTGIVKSFDSAELIVRYHPGVPGKFATEFQLQIAYQEPIKIKVKGFGVFPQVCASLPRPDIQQVPRETGYSAVASLTSDWILTGFGSDTGMFDLDSTKPYRSRESNLGSVGDDEVESEWELVRYLSSVPSEMDVWLATERMLAYNLVSKDTSNNATFAVYARTIPSFYVPAYELDFGVCVIGRTVEQSVTVTNFGPLPVIIYAIVNSHLKEEGIYVRLKNRNELKIGACLPFIVAFHPKKSKYKMKYEKVQSVFYFEVYHGAKIPVNVLAVVTYPHVISSMKVLRFGEVVCGCCKVINLKLYNPGFVPATWSIHTRKGGDAAVKFSIDPVEGRAMFHLNYRTGILYAGQYCSIQVSFKPEFGGSFSAVLGVRVAESLEEIKILLLGDGIEPKLNISQRLLNFKSTLPYPNKVEKIFSVENPCTFPIEFYFSAFDEQINEEERILRAVTLYYQASEILLPVRRPGEGLPPELVDFYHSLLDGLNAMFMEEEREKMIAEREKETQEDGSYLSLEDTESILTTQSVQDKKKKKARKVSRSKTSTDTTRPFTTSNENAREPNVQSIFEKKSWLEIDGMLQGAEHYIASIWDKEPTYDPIQAALKAVLPTAPEEEYIDGTLIIFHGAPFTNSVQSANRAAVFINMPALNIDRIVLEEAAFGRCAAGTAVKELIEQAYQEYASVDVKKDGMAEERTQNTETLGETEYDFELEFEEVQRKFVTLVTLRENILAGKTRNGPPASAKSDGSRKGGTSTAPKPQMNVNAPIANISEDLVVEILQFRLALEVSEGVIIEGLESVLISSPPKALISVLKAAGNVRDIMVIVLLNNYNQYNRCQLAMQTEQDLEKFKFREGILKILEEEPEEILENLNLEPEEVQAIRQLFVAHRRESNAVYEKKKSSFYEMQKLKKAAWKQGLRVPALPLNVQFESGPPTEKKEKEKEKKKEAGKGTKTSDVSNRMSGSDGKSGRVKRDPVEGDFLSFEMDFAEMKAIIESWDQRLGALVVESGSEVKNRKGHSPRKVESCQSAPVTKPKSARGIFLWLVDVSNPDSNSFQSCCSCLKAELQNRIRPSEFCNWPITDPEATTFSVVTAPTPRTNTKLNQAFSISATDSVPDLRLMGEDLSEDMGEYVPAPPPVTTRLNRSLSSISFKSKRKGSATSKRRKTDSRMGIEVKSMRSKKFSSTEMDENVLKSRYILQPGEMQSYRVRYFPTQIGPWEQIYELKFVNWHKGEAVRCVGVCDIPQVDTKPEIMYPAVEHLKPLTTTFHPAYYYQENAYDFGSIIALGDGKKICKHVTLNLANHSTLPVDLCVARMAEDAVSDDSTASGHIKFEPDKFWMSPSQSKQLQVTVSPTKNGPLLDTLLLIVKDNPEVGMVKIKCEGVRPNVTVEPRIVNFDRLLLHRKEYRRAVVTNHNTTPLFVALKGIDHLPPQFTFCQRNGWVPPLGSLTIEIHYDATEVQLINNHPIIVQVFDNNEADEAVQEVPFNISVEAYDAALDIIFANADDDHIDFGDIRVENSYSIAFNLKNVGKYQLGYKIEMDSDFSGELEENNFYVAPQDGKLFPGKLCPIVANIVAQNEIAWQRVPLFKIMLVEPYFGDELIATIPIGVSARSHFSRYEIKPEREFNFGHVKVGSVITRSILIENKGQFSLSYYIELQSQSQSTEDAVETAKKSSKLSASSKDKTEKLKKSQNAFKATGFDISPYSGTAEPARTALINVACSPMEVKRYEDRIVIYVNESLPHLKKGNPITISAEGCLPTVRFDDLKAIFREHFVCKTEAEISSRVKPGTYTVYTEENNLFSFKNVCVNKTVEARLHLQNSGVVECSVRASVRGEGEEEGRGGAFGVSPERLVIEPYSSGCLVVSFRAEALEVYKGRVTMSVEMPETLKEVVQGFDVWGNGILPQIEITEPKSRLPEGQTLVNFPPTSAGHCSVATIAFANTGQLDCRVIIELYKFQNGVFTITPKPSTEKMLKIWDLAKPIDHTAIVSMSPGDVASFDVWFSPTEVQSYSSQIKLFIVDNPFENWSFKLTGEVFFEEVVIEKIRTGLPFLTDHPNQDNSSPLVGPGQYFLNFPDCYVNNKSKVLLRLSNKTENDYFKFEWDEVQSISVLPLNGHLYPNSYKEILLTFHPEEPMELEDVTISCMVNKILLHNPTEPSWDSRLLDFQKAVVAENISPRISEKKESGVNQGGESVAKVTGEEPEYEIVPESNRMLYVNVSGVADYAKLSCESFKIIFKNTFMFQTRTHPIVLENPGNVAVEYKLILKSVTASPHKEHKTAQVAEQSLLRMYRPLTRPQTSIHLSSTSQQQSSNLSNCPKHPRPLTSASFFDVTQNQIDIPPLEQPPFQLKSPPYNPFAIDNVIGRILPKEKVSCNVSFSPMDISDYRAVIGIRVANLHPDWSVPEVEVIASSVMPYCHFDVPESDYLESGRRDYTRPGPIGYAPGIPLHPDTKAVEVKVVGIGVTVQKKFHVINPTEEDYSFSWTNISQRQGEVVPSVHCGTMDGKIRAGRQQLMVFSFVSQKVGVSESFWKFSIPKYGVETPFLFVSDVREAAVYFLSSHLNLRPTFIGSSACDTLTLINNENVAFEFNFLQDSLYSEGKLNCLKLEPLSGKLLPNSETTVRVTFTGKSAGKTVFKVKCNVRTFRDPFVVTVEATTYTIQPLVVFEDLKKVKHFPEVGKENVMEFGSELNPNMPETITLSLTSLSKTSFYYEWDYSRELLDARHCKLRFSVKNGHVASFSRAKCDITIVFSKKSSLINFPLKLKIRRGPTFHFLLNASASVPPFHFSFNSYDFGYCFVQEKDICYNETTLLITNKDAADLFLECTPPQSTAFSYFLPKPVIPPAQQILVPLRFHPRDYIPYEDAITFTVNGIYQRHVHLKGHGTEFKVTLADPEDTTISLGAVKVGKSSTREFGVVNGSLATATVLVGFADQLPVKGQHLAMAEEQPLDLSEKHRLSGVVEIHPSSVFRIKPQEELRVRVTYTPKERSVPFSETVCLQHQETAEPLCLLTGCCLGPEISLDRNFLNFGAVVETCSSTLRLKLVNSGSIGARFEWDTSQLTDYDISPVCGYCSPESDVTISVTFTPSAIGNCIKRSVECVLQLSENEMYPSLQLKLTGDCVSLPEPSQTLTFECFVRGTDNKTVEIDNPSGTDWQILPIISGEYYRGYDALIIPALSSAQYEITYAPLTMTKDKSHHEGSVFFRLPNGRGLLFRLQGVSLPPHPEDTIEREVPCKTKYVELLKIKNWLQSPQRFEANIICVDKQGDPVYSCTGFEKLEVPAMAQKDYSLNFFAYNLGHLRFHVTFVNQDTKEYLWYDIAFKVIMCGPLEVITLKSGVRQTTNHELKLENPLTTPIQYTLDTTSPDVHFQTPLCNVPPQQSAYINISFTPLHPGERTEKITASCVELGVFPRELRLIGVEVQPEPPRAFEVPLGSSQVQEFVVTNLSSSSALLRCKTNSEDFTVAEQATAGAGQSASIAVTYEPSEIGSTSATLFVESEQAGNFAFFLMGICGKPLAKGPFTMKPGTGLSIPFKNVFRNPKEFHMYVDNPSFYLRSSEETLMPKEEGKICIGLQKTKCLEKLPEYRETEIEPRFPVMGQLVVECFSPYVKWQFYLKGVLDK